MKSIEGSFAGLVLAGILALVPTAAMALPDGSNRPPGVGENTGTYAIVSADGKRYNLEVVRFFDYGRYCQLPDGRWIQLS
jgi:hypothetical protein